MPDMSLSILHLRNSLHQSNLCSGSPVVFKLWGVAPRLCPRGAWRNLWGGERRCQAAWTSSAQWGSGRELCHLHPDSPQQAGLWISVDIHSQQPLCPALAPPPETIAFPHPENPRWEEQVLCPFLSGCRGETKNSNSKRTGWRG